ncbi:MAG TPA: hypothetical protein VNJ08_03220 [Bacteriovoracaceae bacterium]|nr:hypothetical protein [Bacteriovoracaceae bacterium]
MKTKLPVAQLIPVVVLSLVMIPAALAVLPIFAFEPTWAKVLASAFAPVIFCLSYTFIAAVYSIPFHKSIMTGKFPRDITHAVYGPRRMYGLCWCAVFYFTPIYYAIMSLPTLRTSVFRLFGYKGHSNISIAPDAWIRDLPLLNLEAGIYVANKATIGTNICMANGNILVEQVTLREGSMVGHLAMIAPGCTLGKKSEVGVGGAIGIRVNIGEDVRIAPSVSINHGTQLHNKVHVGAKSYIGLKAVISEGIKLPGGSNIPDGARIKTQSDVTKYAHAEVRDLSDTKERLENILTSRANF